MAVATNSISPTATVRRDFLLFLLCLVSVLAVCFHKSFEPDQILFSNDGPLGANRSQAEYALGNFLGFWQNLNWIGMEYPGMFLTVSGFLIASCCAISPDFGPVLFAKFYA